MDLPGIYFHLKRTATGDGFNSHGAVLTKKTTMRTSSRRTGLACEKWPPNAIRKDAPVVGGCREKNQGESFFGRHRSWAFWGWWMRFLFHFPNRQAKFRNMVAFP